MLNFFSIKAFQCERTVFSRNGAEYLHAKRMTLNLYLTQYLKIYSQRNRDLYAKPKTSRRRHRILGLGEEFLDTKQNPQSMKEKMIDWTSSELKSSILWKTLFRKQTDKPQPRSKYLQNPYLFKDSSPGYLKNLQNIKIWKHTTQFLQGAKDLKRHVTREGTQMANQHT